MSPSGDTPLEQRSIILMLASTSMQQKRAPKLAPSWRSMETHSRVPFPAFAVLPANEASCRCDIRLQLRRVPRDTLASAHGDIAEQHQLRERTGVIDEV